MWRLTRFLFLFFFFFFSGSYVSVFGAGCWLLSCFCTAVSPRGIACQSQPVSYRDGEQLGPAHSGGKGGGGGRRREGWGGDKPSLYACVKVSQSTANSQQQEVEALCGMLCPKYETISLRSQKHRSCDPQPDATSFLIVAVNSFLHHIHMRSLS